MAFSLNSFKGSNCRSLRKLDKVSKLRPIAKLLVAICDMRTIKCFVKDFEVLLKHHKISVPVKPLSLRNISIEGDRGDIVL